MNRQKVIETAATLEWVADWFDKFGNTIRARDARRMANGLREYADDIERHPNG